MSKAEEYSFNIPSELFHQLTKEQQVLWRKEIKSAFNNGYHQAEKDLGWINVEDRLPKEEFDDGYTFVFVRIMLDKETYRFDVDYIRNGKWELHPNENITHWIPIPPISNKED